MFTVLMTTDLLAKAVHIAAQAHADQISKDGTPYILHPLRVMAAVENPYAKVVAVLHDVVEDSEVTSEDLRAAGFPVSILVAVDALTRREDETYAAFIERTLTVPLAKVVKRADVEDHLMPVEGFTLPKSLEDRYRAAMTKL